jgi:hypothetical protein
MQGTSGSTSVMVGLCNAPILVARGPPEWNQMAVRQNRKQRNQTALKSQKSGLTDSHPQPAHEAQPTKAMPYAFASMHALKKS